MPRAEVGTTKYLNNKLKSKGLQRLRWYCQACERQMRDENGFKCHVQSESHVRQMLLLGEDPRKHIQDFSNQFQRDFLLQLRTSHGEKQVHVNHFYQEYIANKEHIHMNATRWPSLTEFAKFLGREGICRVEETEKGWMISWIDNSPEALRRQDAIRKKERQDRGDEEREQRAIREQVERAKLDAEDRRKDEESQEQDSNDSRGFLARQEGEKIKLNVQLGKSKVTAKPFDSAVSSGEPAGSPDGLPSGSPDRASSNKEEFSEDASSSTPQATAIQDDASSPSTAAAPPISFSSGISTATKKLLGSPSTNNGNKPRKNVFANASAKVKQNPLANPTKVPQKRPMSEAERIMKEELERKERKRMRGPGGH